MVLMEPCQQVRNAPSRGGRRREASWEKTVPKRVATLYPQLPTPYLTWPPRSTLSLPLARRRRGRPMLVERFRCAFHRHLVDDKHKLTATGSRIQRAGVQGSVHLGFSLVVWDVASERAKETHKTTHGPGHDRHGGETKKRHLVQGGQLKATMPLARVEIDRGGVRCCREVHCSRIPPKQTRT